MDPISLDIFCVVAAELSITRAAKRLGRVQSNVTTRIQQLEDELGVALFLRDARRLALSEDGQRFLVYAKRLLALADEARQAMQPAEPSGKLRIGSMESSAATRLPMLMATFRTRYPDVQLSVSTAPSRQLIEQVASGLLDCAFAALPFDESRSGAVGLEPRTVGVSMAAVEPLAAMGLTGEPVWREALFLVLPPGHGPVTNPADIKVRALAAFAQGCTYRAVAEDWLGAAGAGLRIQEVGSYHSMLACVAAGDTVCILPESVLALAPKNPFFKTLPVTTVDTLLVSRKEFRTAAFDAFKEASRAARQSVAA